MIDTLPESRLKDRNQGSKFMDWPLQDGATIRVEVVPVFCANCGVDNGYVPKDNTTFAFFLCRRCFEVYGEIAGTYAEPDQQFWTTVREAMEEEYGHVLDQRELMILAAQGWGVLAPLVKESPIKLFVS